jgi:DNA-binding transcriptional ArsR family regulator
MVETLDTEPDVFLAISHPARRQMLDQLTDEERSVGVIAENFDMSRPAVSQHLRILLDAGLVTERRNGRERLYRATPENLSPVRDWIGSYARFWDDRLLRLQQHFTKKRKK